MGNRINCGLMVMSLAVAVGAVSAPALAQAAPDYDFDWTTIGDVNNAAIAGADMDPYMRGRGSVGYKYRISKYEVTTAQWMEYVNNYSTQSFDMRWFSAPTFWGADLDPDYNGPGNRWVLRTDVPDAGMLPVFGISWRESAQFVNWLHNGKGASMNALANGVYDTSTFTRNADGTYNDQPTRSPGSRFWIPSLDEWVKAAHYNPRNMDGTGGDWWLYPDGGNEPLIPGLPEDGGETSVGMDGFGEIRVEDIPLGAYASVVTSPWGLLDISGGASEWTEEFFWSDFPLYRVADGGEAGSVLIEMDRVDGINIYRPTSTSQGLRIASMVPASGSSFILATGLYMFSKRRR